MKFYLIEDTETCCANCKHYTQHYTQGWKAPVNCGDCTQGKLKHRKPGNSCKHFSRRELIDGRVPNVGFIAPMPPLTKIGGKENGKGASRL